MSRVAGSTPSRRVTRSQSRELDPQSFQSNVGSKGSRTPVKGKSVSNRLSAVTEESPFPSRQTSVSQFRSSVIPESPENTDGNTNISGTTFLEQPDDAESDDEAPGNPLHMVDELPDLQQAASKLMSLLVSSHSDPIDIVNGARRMRTADPRSSESRRLKSHCRKLVERMKQFSPHTFIDIHNVRSLIPAVPDRDGSGTWSPSPALHSANCARLAFELLLSTAESQSARQVIVGLNEEFPILFLDRFANDGSIGTSSAEKPAFELALEIRTQYFLFEFERLQDQKNFDPSSLIQSVFYDDSQHQGNELDSRWLRGFALKTTFQDENQCLPERLHDAVLDRISELRLDLFNDDDAPNLSGLKALFPWKRLSVRLARFLLGRDREIRRDLKTQANFDDIQDLLLKIINGEEPGLTESSPLPDDAPSWPSSPIDENSVQGSFPQETPNSGTDQRHQVQETPASQTSAPIETAQARLPSRDPTVSPPPRSSIAQFTPVSQAEKPTAMEPHRRKSAKGFLNMENINRLKQRMEGHGSASSRQTSRAPERESTANRENNIAGQDFGNETTLHHDADDFDLSGLPEESTTPPGSARTNQISHNGRWFDSPGPNHTSRQESHLQTQQAPPRTYFDRQSNASRVSPINESETQSAERPTQSNNLSRKKRPRQESDDEDDSVNEFEQDTRVADVKAKRAAKPAPRRVRPRQQTDEMSDAGQQLQQQLLASSQHPPSNQPRPPPSSAPVHMPLVQGQTSEQPVLPTSQPALTAEESGWASRNAPGAGNSCAVRRKGGRWSKEEDDRLIQLIAAHGTSWKDILREDKLCPESSGGPVFTLRERSGVDLKDRARVLKRHFEKSGQALPPGFSNVSKVSWANN